MKQAISALQSEVPTCRPAMSPKRTVLWAGELCERWGISQVTLWRWRRAGKVLAPDFQGTGWLVTTIETFEQRGSTARLSH